MPERSGLTLRVGSGPSRAISGPSRFSRHLPFAEMISPIGTVNTEFSSDWTGGPRGPSNRWTSAGCSVTVALARGVQGGPWIKSFVACSAVIDQRPNRTTEDSDADRASCCWCARIGALNRDIHERCGCGTRLQQREQQQGPRSGELRSLGMDHCWVTPLSKTYRSKK